MFTKNIFKYLIVLYVLSSLISCQLFNNRGVSDKKNNEEKTVEEKTVEEKTVEENEITNDTENVISSFSQKEGWLTGFPDVFEKSITENKPIMANFTGSDWCGWCIRLDKAVFQTEEFKKWAEENVILLELDFPRRTKLDPNLQATNNELQNIFQVRGFPTVWLFSVNKADDGKFSINANLSNPFQKMGYMASAKDFISKADYIIEKMNEIY